MQIALLLIAYDSARRMLLEAREDKDAVERSSELQVQESVPMLGILRQC